MVSAKENVMRQGFSVVALVLIAGWGAVRADTIRLKSGAVITGEIVGENARELQVLVSHTQAGDIRTVKFISQDSIAAMQRDKPEVAVEPDPVSADAAAADAKARTTPIPAADPASLRAALKNADSLTGIGRYDEAIQGYRAAIEVAERQRDALRQSEHPEDRALLLEELEVRNEAYARLGITLRGKYDSRRKALDTAQGAAHDLERTITQDQRDIAALRRTVAQQGDMHVQRLGTGREAPAEAKRIRELETRVTACQQRLQAQEEWIATEKLALVALESDRKLASEKAQRALDETEAVQRASRARP
jgi:hypothetical protein